MDSTTPPLDTSCQAVYEDGYVLDETEHDDVNPWGDGNVFRAILNGIPEDEHGRMVEFSCFWRNAKYSIDWRSLPDGARPIRFRQGFARMSVDGEVLDSGWSGVDFGAQWNDHDGSNKQEITELRGKD